MRMSNRDFTRHLIWIFPLLVVVVVGVLRETGASRLTKALLKKKLAQQYGVSEASVENYASRLPLGWRVGDRVELEPAPHKHDWRAGIVVVEGEDTGVVLTFAHMGDGDFPGQDEPLQTSYVMVNNSGQPASGSIHFFDDDGEPLELTVDGVTDSSFPFALNPGQIKRLTTEGVGELKQGWARVRSDQPIVVTSNFGAFREDGSVITDVGVGESELGTEFTIFADTIGSNDTGVAVSNPDDEQAIDIEMTLRNAAGNEVDQEMLHLEPRGHLAVFLEQLFPTVGTINEFEGTVVLRSTTAAAAASQSPVSSRPQGEAPVLPFAGLTLRISGLVFTSVPMVAPLPPDAEFTRMAFPQAADGELGEFRVSTTPVLFNLSDQEATGLIEFFKGDGSDNEVRVGGVAMSAIPFQIPPGGVFRVDTDGVGELAVGWARVAMDRPLAGVAIFTIRDGADTIVAAVGVNSAALRQNFQILADTTGLFDTALALVSPLEPEEGGEEEPTVVQITLREGNGLFLASTQIELLAREHTALFLTQLFPEVEGIDELEGRLEISVSGSADYVAALSLRSALEKLTSVPLFVEQHPFAPTLLFEFAQNLKGTSAAVRLTLHQNDSDSALEFVSARIPGVQLLAENFRGGEQFGSGYLNNPARSVLLVAGNVVSPAGAGSSVAFTMINESDSGLAIQANGTLADDGEGGLLFDLQYLDKKPTTFLGDDADIVIHLDEDLFRLPDDSETTLHSEFVSVSRSTETEERILRRTEQSLDFTDPDPALVNLESVVPNLLVAGESLTLAGSNFGDAPAVLFPGQELESLAFQRKDDSWGVVVPPGSDRWPGSDRQRRRARHRLSGPEPLWARPGLHY